MKIEIHVHIHTNEAPETVKNTASGGINLPIPHLEVMDKETAFARETFMPAEAIQTNNDYGHGRSR